MSSDTCAKAGLSLSVNPALSEVWSELAPLFARNWAESGALFAFEPDLPLYLKMEAAGLTASVLARRGGVAVGYTLAFIVPHHFNPAVTEGTSVVVYVAPEHRTGSVFARLVLATEEAVRAKGQEVLVWNVQPDSPASRAFARPDRGYTLSNLSYRKAL